MNQLLPKIIPVNELKNTANIMKICKESDVPLVITKNGYGEAVMMSIELFEKMFEKLTTAALINESLDDKNNELSSKEGSIFFNKLKNKYGK